jgi:hypothetical protein
MLVYAVVSAVIQKAVDLFLKRQAAEAFTSEVERDEPETAALLSVRTLESSRPSNVRGADEGSRRCG